MFGARAIVKTKLTSYAVLFFCHEMVVAFIGRVKIVCVAETWRMRPLCCCAAVFVVLVVVVRVLPRIQQRLSRRKTIPGILLVGGENLDNEP